MIDMSVGWRASVIDMSVGWRASVCCVVRRHHLVQRGHQEGQRETTDQEGPEESRVFTGGLLTETSLGNKREEKEWKRGSMEMCILFVVFYFVV